MLGRMVLMIGNPGSGTYPRMPAVKSGTPPRLSGQSFAFPHAAVRMLATNSSRATSPCKPALVRNKPKGTEGRDLVKSRTTGWPPGCVQGRDAERSAVSPSGTKPSSNSVAGHR